MSMGNDRALSAEQLAVAANALIDFAKGQQGVCDELLEQLKKDLKAFERGTNELTRDMPTKIARQTAHEVVQSIGDSVRQKVEAVLSPVEAKIQRLLRDIESAAEEYKRVSWRVLVLVACLSGLVSAVLVLALAKRIGI
jgi:hypothetical protein